MWGPTPGASHGYAPETPLPTPMSYKRFFAMIATSTAVMFILMYSTVYAADHVWWSDTKMYMAAYMGATMAVIMLAFMLKMYDDKRVNLAIFGGSAVVFALFFWLVRDQGTVDDVEWMEAMIPHHSIAILTSERAEISDPRVRELADEIIEAQRREIAEMEELIAELDGGGHSHGEGGHGGGSHGGSSDGHGSSTGGSEGAGPSGADGSAVGTSEAAGDEGGGHGGPSHSHSE